MCAKSTHCLTQIMSNLSHSISDSGNSDNCEPIHYEYATLKKKFPVWKYRTGLKNISSSESMNELQTWMIQNRCHCSVVVSPCDPSFWSSREPTSDKYYDECELVITIEFFALPEIAHAYINAPLILTSGSKDSCITTWRSSRSLYSIPYTEGIYKQPGFDDAYITAQESNPELTLEKYVKSLLEKSSVLVKRRYYEGEDDCVQINVKRKAIESQHTEIRFSILACDLGPNFAFIKNILLPLCKV
ncbi:Hypothetical protein HVR_LOCUS1163 [uncultured virus]|nr:Hypothetical protein HVR_LOCUS1163 [uncultured virus]